MKMIFFNNDTSKKNVNSCYLATITTHAWFICVVQKWGIQLAN